MAVLGAGVAHPLYPLRRRPCPWIACTVVDVSPLMQPLRSHHAEGCGDNPPSVILAAGRASPVPVWVCRFPMTGTLKGALRRLMANPADGRGLADWAEQVGRQRAPGNGSSIPNSTPASAHGVSNCAYAETVVEISRRLPWRSRVRRGPIPNQAAFSAMFSRALGISPNRFGER